MNITPTHEYLGKNINSILDVEFEAKHEFSNTNEKPSYTVKKIKDSLYNSVYRNIRFRTDTDNIINKISIWIDGELQKELFEKMCDAYGQPKNIYGLDKLLDSKSSEGINDEFPITSHAFSFSLKKCDFEDNPYLIIWDKGRYIVECTIKRPNAYVVNSETNETIIRIKSSI